MGRVTIMACNIMIYNDFLLNNLTGRNQFGIQFVYVFFHFEVYECVLIEEQSSA